MDKGKPAAAVYGPERVEVPGIDLSSIKKLVIDLGGQYFHREAHYNIYENYTTGEKLGLKFTPPVIAISNSISIYIHKLPKP